MKEIYRYVKDEGLKAELKECSGIGTEATRAGIIEKFLKKINEEDPDDEIEFTGISLDTIRGKQVISYGCKLHGELAEKIWAEFLTGKTAFALMTYEKNEKDE